MSTVIDLNIERIEAKEKVTGKAKYCADIYNSDMLYVKIVTSKIAHGIIKSVNVSEAEKIAGIKAIITGRGFSLLTGILIEDRPILAIDKVRYYGEPVALVVALSDHEAALGAQLVEVEYEQINTVLRASDAIKPNAPIIHKSLLDYKLVVEDIYPNNETNIVSSYKIRKGDMKKGWEQSEVIIEQSFFLPSTDHVAMESRSVKAEIMADDSVNIISSSQVPFIIKKNVSKFFNIEEGKVHVYVPLVGGAFGGKSNVQLELLAVMASKILGGRRVCLNITREQDFATSPGRIELEAKIKLGATKEGILKAAQMTFLLNCGAYANISPYMSKAIACDCSGPYNIENLYCDSLCVYTNQNITTAFRGFAHESYTFCIERAYEVLTLKCNINPLEFRIRNSIKPGQFSPTNIEISKSNAGDIEACLNKLKVLINWDEGQKIDIGNNKIRAKGISCLWKMPNSSTDASSGAFLTFNSDGSINLITGVVEMGSGGQTHLAQILAEKFNMDVSKIHVKLDVDTQIVPQHWKTVASMTSYLAGNAVLKAADDAMLQLKKYASILLRCPIEDLDIGNQKVFIKHEPKYAIEFAQLVSGIKFSNGNAYGGHILGRGNFIMSHLNKLDKNTGQGKPGPAWTVGAQAVEVEYDFKEYTYRLIKSVTVMDVGKVINPKAMQSIIMGGMSMGLSLASREEIVYDERCIMQTTSLRNYKLLHIGQEPKYLVDFVQTPQEDAPYGTRAISEHGIIGIPAALANALSIACGKDLNKLPLTPENIWSACTQQ